MTAHDDAFLTQGRARVQSITNTTHPTKSTAKHK